MEHVLLYSKYSPESNRLVDMINKSGVKIPELAYVCIDNDNIRKRVKKDKKLQINLVPCILIYSLSGRVEKYEGASAFEWVDQIIKERLPPPPPPLPMQMPTQPVYRQPPVEKEPEEKPKKQKKTAPQPVEELTSIDELDSENEDEPSPQQRDDKPDAKAIKTANLMAEVMAMQKEREAIEPKNPRQR